MAKIGKKQLLVKSNLENFYICVNMTKRVCAVFIALAFFACSSDDGEREYGGPTYKAIDIGDLSWMAENLNYDISGSRCYGQGELPSPEEAQANCDKYGRLYNWATAMNLPDSCNKNSCINQIAAPHKGICPSGWHIPSDAEWAALIESVGGPSIAGKKLKAKSGWNSVLSDGNGEDVYKFAALPGGLGSSIVTFYYAEYDGYWWSALDSKDENAFGQKMSHGSDGAFWDRYPKSHLLSVRCARD